MQTHFAGDARRAERFSTNWSLRWMRPRNDDAYLFGNPETAARLTAALNDAREGRRMTPMTMEELEAMLATHGATKE
jgi:hypothetical protein